MIWSASFSKDTCVIFAYLTFEVGKYVVNFINFYFKKKVSPMYPSRKRPSFFSLCMNN